MSQAEKGKTPFLARGLKLNLVSSIVTKLSGLAQLFLISRGMGLEVYGAWALLNNAVGYLTQLVSLSLPNAFVRFHPTQADAHRYERLLTLACISAAGAVCIPFALAAPWISRTFLRTGDFTNIIRVGSVLIVLNVARLFLTDTLRARALLNRSALVNIGFELIETGAIAVAVLSRHSLLWVMVVEALAMVTVGGFLMWRVFRAPDGSASGSGSEDLKSVVKEYLSYSIPLMPSALLAQVASNGDRFLVGYYLGAAQVGLYNSLYAVGSVVMIFNTPFTNVLLPRIVRQFAASDVAGAHRDVLRFCSAFFIIGVLGIVALLVFGPWILPVVLKLGTLTPAEASRLSALLMLALTVFGTTRIYCLHLHARSRTRSLLVAFGSGVVVNQAANAALIPLLGLSGTFLACLLSYCVIALILWRMVRRLSTRSTGVSPGGTPAQV